jgi:tetratricopeptide (TPR) repeat protein
MFLAFEERLDEAITLSKRSLAIDPFAPLINMNAGWTYFTAGLLEETREQVAKMIEIEPEFYGSYWLKGAICLVEGKYESAIDELKKGFAFGGHQTVLADLGSAYGLAGRREEAESVLNQLLEMRRSSYVSAICLARVYARIGEKDKAIEWLEKAFDERNGEMLFLKEEIDSAPENDPLADLGTDPRLITILHKMDLPKENR